MAMSMPSRKLQNASSVLLTAGLTESLLLSKHSGVLLAFFILLLCDGCHVTCNPGVIGSSSAFSGHLLKSNLLIRLHIVKKYNVFCCFFHLFISHLPFWLLVICMRFFYFQSFHLQSSKGMSSIGEIPRTLDGNPVCRSDMIALGLRTLS